MEEKKDTGDAFDEVKPTPISNNGEDTAHLGGEAARRGVKGFLIDALAGYGIGVAFIIPGFSGGSMAAIFGIYERLIGAIADIFKTPVKSIKTLLPIFLGLCVGAVSLLYPLGWALEAFPLPTVSLFVGLALGGMFSITDKVKGRIKPANAVAFTLPALIALAMIFVPTGADVDLFNLNFGGYVLLFLVGMLGSAALVIPGISGSMILLILGYYNPIIQLITQHFLKGQNMLTAFLVLVAVGLGIIVGFIGISVIMKVLLKKYNRGTYFAIIGFIVGSIPTAFISTAKDAGYTAATLPTNPWYWICSVLLLCAGFAAALFLVVKAKGLVRSDRTGE